jgi:hypothetical protein
MTGKERELEVAKQGDSSPEKLVLPPERDKRDKCDQHISLLPDRMRSAKAVVSEKLARLGSPNMSYSAGGMRANPACAVRHIGRTEACKFF